MRQTTIDKLRARVAAEKARADRAEAALVKGAPAKDVKAAITDAFAKFRSVPEDLGTSARSTAQGTAKNRKATSDLIFAKDINKGREDAKARAVAKAAVPRKGSAAWKKDINDRADERAAEALRTEQARRLA